MANFDRRFDEYDYGALPQHAEPTLQEQALEILGRVRPEVDKSVSLDSAHARELAASILVPILSLVQLHAKDLATRPVLEEGIHQLLSEISSLAVTWTQRWSTEDQLAARREAEDLLRQWLAPRKPVIVTGLRSKVIGGVFPSGTIQ